MFNGTDSGDEIDTVALNLEKKRLRDSIETLERINAKRLQDSVDNARRYNAIKASIAQIKQEEQEKYDKEVARETEKEEKKRRRKFFDIRFEKRE
jgi:L-lactate utilization protein LutB